MSRALTCVTRANHLRELNLTMSLGQKSTGFAGLRALDTQGQRCVRHFLEAGTFDAAEIILEEQEEN